MCKLNPIAVNLYMGLSEELSDLDIAHAVQDQTQLQSFFSVIRKDLSRHSGLNRLAKRYYLDGIENRLIHRSGFPNPKCVALSSHMRLLPDGSLPTCQFNSTIVGNLRRQEFNQIWFSDAIARQRA